MNLLEKDFLTIITARKGSKRVPNKNIRPLAGQPLINWTFQAAKDLKLNHDIFVSTDCPLIQDLSLSQSLLCPELRPEHLARDDSTSTDVVKHTLHFCQTNLNRSYQNIILLQPTSPLRTSLDIKNAIDLFNSKHADAVQSFSPAECPPMWINQLDHDLRSDNFIPRVYKNVRSQDLGQYYRINGAVYIIKTHTFLSLSSFLVPNSFAYLMPRERSIDIDDEFDFKVADLLLTSLKNYQ